MATENLNIVIKAHDKTKRTFSSLKRGLSGIKQSVFSLQGALIALGAGAVTSSFLTTASSLEKLKVSLKTVTGSAENAEKAFKQMTEFTTRTPYEIEQVANAFIKLKAFGLDPSEAALTSFGNTASAMGKDLNQMIEAVADAATGEFERLKEFGIKSKQQGDQVAFTFQGITTTVKKESEAIQGYLMNIGNNQFGGAMADQMDTMGGAMSNFRGSWSLFQNELMNAGPFDIAKGALNSISETLFGKAGSLSSNAKSAGEAISSFIKNTVIGLSRFVDATKGYVQATWGAIKSLWGAFKSMPAEVQSIGIVGLFLGGFKLKLFMVGILSSIKTIKGFLGMSNVDNALLTNIAEMNDELGRLNLDLMALNEANLTDSPLANKLSKQASFLSAAIEALENGTALDITTTGNGDLKELVMDATNITIGMGSAEAAAVKFFDTIEAKKNTVSLADTLGEGNNVATVEPVLVDLVSQNAQKRIDIQSEYHSRYESHRREHYKNLIDQTHLYLQKQKGIKEAQRYKDFEDLKASGISTLSLVSGQYKKAFALNKAFAIKDALVNTYKAVAAAYSSALFPVNIGLAALALGSGIAQVQSIRATQFREKGGPMTAGSPYIVGERGPELIVPNQAANVVPNDQMGGNNYTINISANDTAGFDELLIKRRGTVIGLINQALNENGRAALV